MPDTEPAVPQFINEAAALWAASATARSWRGDADQAAALRDEVVADLPAIDDAARRWSQLGAELDPTRVRVLGRLGWVRTNLASFQGAFEPLRSKLGPKRALTGRVLGVQLGAVLGLLSSKVLGQYVLPLGGEGSGHLVVVGPNILDLAQEHGGLAVDVRRTVLLHEVTHRLQFDSTPWLGAHLRDLVSRYLAATRVDASAIAELAPRLPEAVAEARSTGDIQPLLSVVLTPGQVEVIDEAQGLMTLLEGHGNTAMAEAADGLVSDTEGVRQALASRHGDVTSKVLTAVAGLEMKRRQYREGEVFVRTVIEQSGVAGLNRAFSQPQNLPSLDEVADPAGWLTRVG
ncbi:MAG: zinc-dependent metalloprotease [Chloroflexota bacterium]